MFSTKNHFHPTSFTPCHAEVPQREVAVLARVWQPFKNEKARLAHGLARAPDQGMNEQRESTTDLDANSLSTACRATQHTARH